MASKKSQDTGIHTKMKVETGVVQPNPKIHKGFLAIPRRQGGV